MPIIGATPSPVPGYAGPPPGTALGPFRLDLGQIGFGLVDGDGIAWVCTDLSGWHGGAGVAGQVTQKPTGHGAWLGPAWYAARQITIEATIVAPDPARRDDALRQLAVELQLDRLALLRVQAEPQPLESLVRRAGEVEVHCDTRRTAKVQIPLIAPDPRRYLAGPIPVTTSLQPAAVGGATSPLSSPISLPEQPSGGRITLTNSGDMPCPWTARFTGPITRPSLTNLTNGLSLDLDLVLGAGEWLDLDARAGTVRLMGGADRSGRISFDTDWWHLDLGRNDLALSGTPGPLSPTLTVTAHPCRS